MKRIAVVALQMALVLIGTGALVFLLGEPHFEGRNKHATLLEIYFKDPFLAYAYVGSVPFFVALYQAFTVLGYVVHDQAFSPATVHALRTIRICAKVIVGFVAGSGLFFFFSDPDDWPAGLFLRVLIGLPAIVAATAVARLERVLRHALEPRPESD
ncbi:MAG: DUF2975 domain-containing protein [Pirellulales bacterium]|nr:DUF2975 domain-containing protein [Pirellulales bacterium]